MKYLILSGGTPPSKSDLSPYVTEAEMIIGVDGAADILLEYNIVPNVLIGDFDTATDRSVEKLKTQGAKVVRLSPRKNETDTEAAVNYALSNNASSITVFGALGSRVDHSLSNIMMLVRAHRAGVPARIIDEYNELQVENKHLVLKGTPGQTVSILPLTGNLCVSATNLVYPLNELELNFGSSRGVSNVMANSKAEINIKGGYALIIKTTDEA